MYPVCVKIYIWHMKSLETQDILNTTTSIVSRTTPSAPNRDMPEVNQINSIRALTEQTWSFIDAYPRTGISDDAAALIRIGVANPVEIHRPYEPRSLYDGVLVWVGFNPVLLSRYCSRS
jgi:hypothetical protein